MAVNEINIAFATPISILIENAFSTFNFQNAPLNWSEVAFRFLQPANHHIHVEVLERESIVVLDWDSPYL